MRVSLPSIHWEPEERSALSSIQDNAEGLLSLPLDGENSKQHFDLYYFVHRPQVKNGFKSVLFCAGGPGQIVRPLDRSLTYADFLSKNGYHVVYFHLRGTGFSQIPSDIQYDPFLSVRYAVRDADALRAHFMGKATGDRSRPWDAIVAWSFGAVIAQEYAEKIPKSVRKLVLISPISRHKFCEKKDVYEDYYRAMLKIYRRALDEIYTSKSEVLQNEFGDLTSRKRKRILDALFGSETDPEEIGILKRTEEAFGSISFVIDAYAEIGESEFKNFRLRKYSQTFYAMLRDLRFYGVNSTDGGGIREKQRLIGKVLRDEILNGELSVIDRATQLDRYSQGSQRAYYSYGVRDGINWMFLRQHRSRGVSANEAVTAVGGQAFVGDPASQVYGKWLSKVTLEPGASIPPWDPADHHHSVPTLILDGQADPVTADGQAMRFFVAGLKGPRTLIRFPGVGHQISIGGTEKEHSGEFHARAPLISGAIQVDKPEILPGQIKDAVGFAAGCELDVKLRIDLEPPRELRNRVELCASGVVQSGWGGKERNAGNIIALIKNLTRENISVDNTEWKIYNHFFVGTVKFSAPRIIKPHGIQPVYGVLIDGAKNRQLEFYVEPKKRTNERISLVGFNVVPPSSVELWIHNHSNKTVDEQTREWTIYKRKDFTLDFKVNLPKLKAGEIKCCDFVVDGLNVDPNEVLTVEPPKRLRDKIVACIAAPKGSSKRLSLTLWNQGTDGISTKMLADSGKWQVKCAAFSASIVLDPVNVESEGIANTRADIVGISWVNCLELRPSTKLQYEVALVSFNILEQDKISMLFENRGQAASGAAQMEWLYADPHADANLSDLSEALNSLIFSYLVRNPEGFRKLGGDKVLERIAGKFKGEGLEFRYLPPETAMQDRSDTRSAQTRRTEENAANSGVFGIASVT
jgi:pimeloyl-ACP methyl ester carboxylesterase